MDPIPVSPQSNQNPGSDKLNSQPGNAFKTSNGINFNVKVPPEGILDSPKAVLNSNSEFRQDKNIKIDLGLNSVPEPEYNEKPGFLPKPDLQSKQSNQNNSLLAQAQGGGNKNSDHFKLSNSEVQGPKPPLVPKNSNKIVFAVIVIIALGALVAGGYYLMQKNNDTPAVVTPTPSPEPVINPVLDTDSDTIPDVVEGAIGTSSSKADTDGDSFSDLSEIKNGYSPLISGGAGKYTPEDLQILMDKIKAADPEFYGKEFGAPAEFSQGLTASISPVGIKKCEFPEKISNYSKQEDVTPDTQETGSSKPKGVLLAKFVTYTDFLDWNNISILNFNTEEDAKAYLEGVKPESKECSISGKAGFCKNDYVASVGGDRTIRVTLNSAENNFTWREDKMVKKITALAQRDMSKSKEDVEKQAAENLNLFVSNFKDCAIE